MRMLSAVFAALVLALAVSACGSSDDKGATNTSSSSNDGRGYGGSAYGGGSTSTAAGASAGTSGGEMEMDDNYFKPAVISGKPGQTVTINLKNEGQAEHNFKIDGQSADADVEPGKTATVKVKIPMSGTVQFYCEYHKSKGMVGTVKAS